MISSSGTFSATTPSSAFSEPGDTWSFSFVVDDNPSVSNVVLGEYFDVSFSAFNYTLNGASVAITPVDIRFFSTVELGMFDICFNETCSGESETDGFAYTSNTGQQMYTGDESAPTMLTGTFTPTGLDVEVGGAGYLQVVNDVDSSEIPEPSTLLTLGVGILLALAGQRLRRPA
jgi:hypothetical protein